MVALSQQSGIPKLALCRSFSITGFHTLKNEALFQHLDVELDLIFQFAPGSPLLKQCPKLCHENAYPAGHSYRSPCKLSTRAMTPEIRSQLSVSIASCFRPALVIE